ncbi:MAG: patatin-like phospholipase family protein [Candidatus Obscuribacterales bacterium]
MTFAIAGSLLLPTVASAETAPESTASASTSIASTSQTASTTETTTTTTTTTTAATTTRESNQTRRPKIGLALGGGGARGAAHVGVLRILEREGIHVDMIAGTSVGAIVGGMYCAGLSVDEIEKQFTRPHLMRSYMTAPIWMSVVAQPIFLIPRIVGWRPYDGFYFGNKFRNYYRRCLPKDRHNIEDLNIPFRAMTTNLVDGQQFVVDHGDLPRAIQASSAIPVLRRAVGLSEDQVLVDGAVLVNVPVDEVRKMGADIVIAVSVSEHLETVPGKNFKKIGSVGRRLEQIFLSHTDTAQMAHSDLIIHPRTDNIGILSTDARDAKRGIKAGEEAATETIPAIRQKIESFKGNNP